MKIPVSVPDADQSDSIGSPPAPATILRFAQNGEIAQHTQRQPFHTVKMRELSLANIDLDKFKQLLATHIDGGAHLLLAVPLNGQISKSD
ncbi:MAG: hypothetical protein ACJAVI_006305 [Candidatus Azotimanducaceae bacterium]